MISTVWHHSWCSSVAPSVEVDLSTFVTFRPWQPPPSRPASTAAAGPAPYNNNYSSIIRQIERVRTGGFRVYSLSPCRAPPGDTLAPIALRRPPTLRSQTPRVCLLDGHPRRMCITHGLELPRTQSHRVAKDEFGINRRFRRSTRLACWTNNSLPQAKATP